MSFIDEQLDSYLLRNGLGLNDDIQDNDYDSNEDDYIDEDSKYYETTYGRKSY